MGFIVEGSERSIVSSDVFDVHAAEFMGLHTDGDEGGGLLVNLSIATVSVSHSLFVNCSAFKRGGAFSIIAASAIVRNSCSRYCYLNFFEVYFNGNGGNIDAASIRHNLSIISQCVPKGSGKNGNCLFGLRRSEDAKANNINATHCDKRGAFDWQKKKKRGYWQKKKEAL